MYRHFAWLTALRYELRKPRVWESMNRSFNIEYQRFYRVPEHETAIEELLPAYLSEAELAQVLSTESRATKIISMQSAAIRRLHRSGQISSTFYMEMERTIRDLIEQQARVDVARDFRIR